SFIKLLHKTSVTFVSPHYTANAFHNACQFGKKRPSPAAIETLRSDMEQLLQPSGDDSVN
ncbi:MAG: hypothetical protein E6921_10785, partial [Klebsiella michiganensis]|nr:hypothetical protein [Klebsiella michiganensis]